MNLLPLAIWLSGAIPHQDLYPAPLPPVVAWDGASRELVAADDDPWITPAEKSGFVSTPSYEETIAWVDRLVAASEQLHKLSLGKSPEGRELVMIIASKEGEFTPEAMLASEKARLLAHGGIHAGEIDGKDAGLMLLRDLTVAGTKSELLEEANFLFVPIFNVDGHERRSPYGRVNQRGPQSMGWRTNARNLNLNRDYAKVDTDEMRAMIAAINRWQPDLYLDLHVTDGVDYQYDITFGSNGAHGWSPASNAWLEGAYRSDLNAALEAMGHIPGPLVFGVNGVDMSAGMFAWTGSPRFSSSYGDARHLPTILVENHSLKPYDQRVLGTYVLLEASLRVLARDKDALRALVARDAGDRPESLPTRFEVDPQARREVTFKGIRSKRYKSEISGAEVTEWLGEAVEQTIPYVANDRPAGHVSRPAAYWIPPAWSEVIERLEFHGVAMERLAEPRTIELEFYRMGEPTYDPQPFEGRVRVRAKPEPFKKEVVLAPGSVRISTEHALGDLVVLLLEPIHEDSFFQWGFFHSIFSRTEYIEPYVLEPLARRMLEADPELRAAFERALEDEEFSKDPAARLAWFYERTPYFDPHWRVYPVGREL